MTTRLHRRNFLPTLIVNLVLWVLVVLIIVLVSPNTNWPWRVIGFGFILWSAVGLTASLLIGKSKTGFLLATIVVGALVLRVLL